MCFCDFLFFVNINGIDAIRIVNITVIIIELFFSKGITINLFSLPIFNYDNEGILTIIVILILMITP